MFFANIFFSLLATASSFGLAFNVVHFRINRDNISQQKKNAICLRKNMIFPSFQRPNRVICTEVTPIFDGMSIGTWFLHSSPSSPQILSVFRILTFGILHLMVDQIHWMVWNRLFLFCLNKSTIFYVDDRFTNNWSWVWNNSIWWCLRK